MEGEFYPDEEPAKALAAISVALKPWSSASRYDPCLYVPLVVLSQSARHGYVALTEQRSRCNGAEREAVPRAPLRRSPRVENRSHP